MAAAALLEPVPSAILPCLESDGCWSGSEGGSKRSLGGGDGDVAPVTPARKLRRLDSCGSALSPGKAPAPLSGGEVAALEAAAAAATRIFDEFSVAYLRKYHSRNDEVARKLAEALVPGRYGELAAAIVALLPFVEGSASREAVPEKQRESLGSHYEVVEFQGRPIPRQQARKCEEVWQQLLISRQSSDAGLARDALCAAMAAISSREGQAWLDAVELESEWKRREQGQPRWRRKDLFEEMLRESLAQGARGYFCNALLQPESRYRIALARGRDGLVPASLLVTYSLSMSKALSHMDTRGPIRGKPAQWRRFPHFALQELHPEEPKKEGTRYERIFAGGLKPEPAIRDMIRSGAPVVMLDAFAALAPRGVCRDQGLSAIVREELDRLLREAKARRQGVVFMLGGDDPETLARKVYLRPPFTNYGLRIGHLRWRETADGPWAREKHDDIRILIGLQLP